MALYILQKINLKTYNMNKMSIVMHQFMLLEKLLFTWKTCNKKKKSGIYIYRYTIWWHMPELIRTAFLSFNKLLVLFSLNEFSESIIRYAPWPSSWVCDKRSSYQEILFLVKGKWSDLFSPWSLPPLEPGALRKPPVAHMYWVSTCCILEQQALWRQTLQTFCSTPKKIPKLSWLLTWWRWKKLTQMSRDF